MFKLNKLRNKTLKAAFGESREIMVSDMTLQLFLKAKSPAELLFSIVLVENGFRKLGKSIPVFELTKRTGQAQNMRIKILYFSILLN